MKVNPKKLILAAGLMAALVLTGLTGCTTTSSSSDERTAGRRKDDKTITAQVEKSLKESSVYKFPDVNVQTFDGVVQLSGFVGTDAQKQQAAQLAQQVPNVRQVANGLMLKPMGEALSPAGSPTGQRIDATTQPQQPVPNATQTPNPNQNQNLNQNPK